ncbi:MAG: Uracil-DNA glycosylase superfamily [Betaproteobacteria bacterium]|jgi:uracil-DNA glycosylase family 4|nr:Uracil-DNA glycosylase superfamily [Betaproteobacteria bacterium]
MTHSLEAAAEAPFSTDCRACPRLAQHLAQVRAEYADYHARPVPAFGVDEPRLLIVGLAPGMHGANRTGRPFTGDYAGILLYETLHRYGYSNQPKAVALDDGLELSACRITNAVKCLPPENKPQPDEVRRCNTHLKRELELLPKCAAILALGAIAHQAVLMAFSLRRSDYVFSHGARHTLPDGRALFDSYHCSRYNTQTRRLTDQMFRDVFEAVGRYLN